MENQSNHISLDRRSSCCSYCQDLVIITANIPENKDLLSLTPNMNDVYVEDLLSLTPPLNNIYVEDPSPYNIYLLNLFLAPDMKRYLQEASFSDDVYNIPIHLQKLISEAIMETALCQQKETVAYNKLLKLGEYIHVLSNYDTSNIIHTLNELIHDEDELVTILGE